MSDPMIGEIRLFPYNWAPADWLPCDGRKLDVSQYQALFVTLGYTYGGDQPNTFALPDLRGRVAVGFGEDPSDVFDPKLASTGGVESVSLTLAQVPPHTHILNGATIDTPRVNEVAAPAGNWLGKELLVKKQGAEFSAAYAVAGTAADATLNSGTLSPYQGLSQPHENRQPYLVLGYYIATKGEYFPNPN